MELGQYVDEIIKEEPYRIIFGDKSNKEYKYNKVKINRIEIKGKFIYQVEKFTDKQVFHENLNDENIKDAILDLFSSFKQLNADSSDYTFNIRVSKKGKVFFSKKGQKNSKQAKQGHNKQKNYILKEGMSIPPLVDLGIFTKEGKVVNSKYDKYKQINRFVEIIDDEVRKIDNDYSSSGDNTLNILDFGCGKSYLTFILYYYFTEIKNMKVNITGLDLKDDVIDNCNKIAQKYGYDNLVFEKGDINGYKYTDNIDMIITLHACDTATDFALYNAIKWNAKMIFSVPCCQHEINESISTDSLSILTKYGIVKERVSALFTDVIRANLLEVMGYKTQMLEFIDISHSPKNILIRATRSKISENKKKKSLEEVENLMKEFKFEQTLYKLLKDDKKF